MDHPTSEIVVVPNPTIFTLVFASCGRKLVPIIEFGGVAIKLFNSDAVVPILIPPVDPIPVCAINVDPIVVVPPNIRVSTTIVLLPIPVIVGRSSTPNIVGLSISSVIISPGNMPVVPPKPICRIARLVFPTPILPKNSVRTFYP